MSSFHSFGCLVSGTRIIRTSAQAATSDGAATSWPAALATAMLFEDDGRPTFTVTPESARLPAWAWPCEP
jgi:hypothetical protein